jgi:hypothetical protein
MSKETLGTDINGKVDFSLPKPTRCRDVILAASTVKTVTAPANYNRAFLSYAVGTNVWVTFDGSAPVVPVGDADSTQELNPSVRQLNITGGDTLKFISDSASYVSIRWDTGS